MKRQKIGSLHSIILNNPGNSPKKRTEISNEPNYQNAPKKKQLKIGQCQTERQADGRTDILKPTTKREKKKTTNGPTDPLIVI